MTPYHKMFIQNLVYCIQKQIMYTSSALYMYSLINFKTQVNKPCLVYQGERTIPTVVLWQHLEAKARIKPTVTRHTECPHLRTAHRIHIFLFSSSTRSEGCGKSFDHYRANTSTYLGCRRCPRGGKKGAKRGPRSAAPGPKKGAGRGSEGPAPLPAEPRCPLRQPRSPSPSMSRSGALNDRGEGGEGKKGNWREGRRSPALVPAEPLRRRERSRPGGGLSTARRGAAGLGGTAHPGLREPSQRSAAAEAAPAPRVVTPLPPPSSRRAIQIQPRPGRREAGLGPLPLSGREQGTGVPAANRAPRPVRGCAATAEQRLSLHKNRSSLRQRSERAVRVRHR